MRPRVTLDFACTPSLHTGTLIIMSIANGGLVEGGEFFAHITMRFAYLKISTERLLLLLELSSCSTLSCST